MKRLLLILLFPLVVTAQKNYPLLLDQYMQAMFKVKNFNGTVLVVKKGKILYQKAFGLADREWHIANTISTKYRVGSITKQFTAAGILQLEEQGKLSVEDKLSKYFADYPKGDSVTIHMLLNHTSGIKNYTELASFFAVAALPLSTDTMISLFKNEPYNFSPGSAWSYSNSGYFLLGVIIEKVSGKKYSDYVYQNVIKKAGLKNTDVDRLDSVLQFRAKGYKKSPGGWQHADYISMEGPYSAGAICSTTQDLYKWMMALTGNKIVSAAATQRMTTSYMGKYGYGLVIDSLQTHKRIWHNGGIPGFVSSLAYYPGENIYVVALSNNESNSDQVTASLASILFDIPVFTPYNPKEIKIDPSILDLYIGKYMATSPIELVKKDNKLYRYREGSPDIELKPESTTRFFYADGSDRFIEFKVDKNGKPEKAFFIAGEKIEMKKL